LVGARVRRVVAADGAVVLDELIVAGGEKTAGVAGLGGDDVIGAGDDTVTELVVQIDIRQRGLPMGAVVRGGRGGGQRRE
jgi:hypothetical protein